jgi:mono/diheme cytochrome c family protein
MRKSKPKLRMFAALLGGSAAVMLFTGLEPVIAQNGGGDAFDGQWRYETSCQTCHGENGEGIYAFGPPLKGDPFVMNAPAETIINVIQNGRYNRDKSYKDYSGMPAFNSIRAGEVRALVAYLKGGLQR